MNTFTIIHVLISLAGILSGGVIVAVLLAERWSPAWNLLFLVSTILTSITGFFFPFHGFTPAHAVGVLSLIVLSVSLFALYARHLDASWRRTYIVTIVFAFYLNFFVLVVQLFQKIPALKALAPTQSEPPFVIAQSVTLLAFVALGFLAVRRARSRPQSVLAMG